MNLINDRKIDPALTHTLSEFISHGIKMNALSYTKFSFTELNGNIRYPFKMVLNDYKYELKQLALKCTLSDDEYTKYRFNPKRLSYDIYNSTEYYYVILLLNDTCNIKDFDMKTLYMLKKEDLVTALSSIYNAEKVNILTYNSKH